MLLSVERKDKDTPVVKGLNCKCRRPLFPRQEKILRGSVDFAYPPSSYNLKRCGVGRGH